MNAMAPILYPWLQPAWKILSTHIQAGRIPQALLIHGQAGLGKAKMAELFARKLLCENPAEFACGVCSSCRLAEVGSHPDLKRAEPDELGKAIKVEIIRKLLGDLSLKPQYHGYRVVIINPAHQMNVSSANALLKTLEEPPERQVFLLISSQPADLPATILSRCQKLPIHGPSRTNAELWLNSTRPGCQSSVLLSASKGSPLRALAMADSDVPERRQSAFEEFCGVCSGRLDPVMLAERWLALPYDEIIDWLLTWVADLMRLHHAPSDTGIINPDFVETLGRFAKRLDSDVLATYWDALLQHRRSVAGQANKQLVLEEMLIQAAMLRHSLH